MNEKKRNIKIRNVWSNIDVHAKNNIIIDYMGHWNIDFKNEKNFLCLDISGICEIDETSYSVENIYEFFLNWKKK